MATVLLGLAALSRRSVSPSGAAAGLVVGIVLWLGGDWPVWLMLAAFFVSSSLLGIPAKRLRPRVEGKHQRGSRRSWQQVAANTSPMVVASLVLPMAVSWGSPRVAQALLVAITSGFAAAASDTWAGELGVLSPHPPRLLWGWTPVEAGQSGGVTLLGLGGALAGALALAAVGFLAGLTWPLVGVAAVCGFAASVADSLLGATVQALYRDQDGQWTERPDNAHGLAHDLVRGWRWMNNDVVNFVSVAVAAIAALLWTLLLT